MTERDLPQEAVEAAQRAAVFHSAAGVAWVEALLRVFHEHPACDCVSREAVIEALTDHYIHNTVCSDFKKAIEVIERAFPSKSAAVSQETVEALQHVINTYIAPRRIDWSDPGYAEQAKVDLAFILNASPPAVSPEGGTDD